uniref:Uncharacterized protein n=1 Tax=Arundo donax TaxID=35708 RepID=A0A0A9AN72_ARUDO
MVFKASPRRQGTEKSWASRAPCQGLSEMRGGREGEERKREGN